jgi:hypothetical protein
MLFLGVISPLLYIRPVYARPPILTTDEAALVADHVGLEFDDKIELVAYEVGAERLTTGQFVPITLYWRALADMEANYTVSLGWLGPDERMYGQVAAYPGHGNYPTSFWKEGEIIEDAYTVRVGPRFPVPGLARFTVALYTYPDLAYLPLVDSEGTQVGRTATIARFAVEPALTPSYSIQHPEHYELGEQVSLLGYDVDDRLLATGGGYIDLYWQARAEMTEDYTVFVHVVDGEGHIVAQSDRYPRGGSYPTSYWREGETVSDRHHIRFPSDLPPGRYRVLAGMYLLETMQRLAAFDDDGNRVRDDQCPLGEWTVTTPGNRGYLPLAME